MKKWWALVALATAQFNALKTGLLGATLRTPATAG